jgi:hypothetical protein
MCRPGTRVERRAAVCADIKRAQAIAKKGGRPEAALSLGRKRPRRAYANVSPHRKNIMLRAQQLQARFFCAESSVKH